MKALRLMGQVENKGKSFFWLQDDSKKRIVIAI
jgi:hypothetical protein